MSKKMYKKYKCIVRVRFFISCQLMRSKAPVRRSVESSCATSSGDQLNCPTAANSSWCDVCRKNHTATSPFIFIR
uniref:Uncharacterized protein n=1 Tax=Parascaris univalens TaxID=6257 RepID=A0A915A7J9_PARUN